MVNSIDKWIDQTLIDYSPHAQSCNKFKSQFSNFYPESFLSKSYFVVVNTIPKPNFTGLKDLGLDDFINMDVDGITYKNTYFIKTGMEDRLALHFHELVHVLQWQYLGSNAFINRYIHEIKNFTYCHAPLEKMAYLLENHFTKNLEAINVPGYVQQNI